MPNQDNALLYLDASHSMKGYIASSKDDRFKNKSNLDTLLDIEQKYPNVKLIVAHIGRAYAMEDVGDAFIRLKDTKNMHGSPHFEKTFNLPKKTLEITFSLCYNGV